MKKFVIISVVLIVFVSILLVLNMGQHKSIRGIVDSVDTSLREISLHHDNENILLKLSHEVNIVDSKNMPSFLAEINPGFEIIVDFHVKDTVYYADKIKITKSPNIIILSPKNNSSVSSTFTVSGISRTFENTLMIEVVEPKTKQVLIKKYLTADAKDIGLYGNFETNIDLTFFPHYPSLSLSAFQYSAKDGSIIDKTTVSLQIEQEVKTSVSKNVFFNTTKNNPHQDCEIVEGVSRSFDYNFDLVNSVLMELTKGPNQKEKDTGMSSSIPAETKVNKISIQNNVLYVDFNQKLQEGVGGSCRVGAIIAQLTNTFKNLGYFENVVISIDNKTEDILQP